MVKMYSYLDGCFPREIFLFNTKTISVYSTIISLLCSSWALVHFYRDPKFQAVSAPLKTFPRHVINFRIIQNVLMEAI